VRKIYPGEKGDYERNNCRTFLTGPTRGGERWSRRQREVQRTFLARLHANAGMYYKFESSYLVAPVPACDCRSLMMDDVIYVGI
jgi:hypothetical protein